MQIDFVKRVDRIKALCLAVLRKFDQDGVGAVVRRLIEVLREWLVVGTVRDPTDASFDREFGTDTDGVVPLWKLQIKSPNREQGVRYQASDPDFVRMAIQSLPIRHEEFVYIDLGSGKGRTLLVASEYPFQQVIGIEFSAELSSIAAINILRYRSPKRRCTIIESICIDASSYDFPDENTILFMYNPFGEDVLRRVLQNLRKSLTQMRREVFVIYSNPVFARLFDETDFLERIDSPLNAVVYRHAPKRSVESNGLCERCC